jgi:TRAP-type C4-dicarboxylate transport system permease small subunit
MNEHKVGMFRSGYKLNPALDAIYRNILRICDILAATALAIEVVLITVNVSGRFFFNNTFGWMDEFAQYTLLWLFVPGSIVLMDRYALFYAEVLLLFIKNVTIRRTIFAFNSLLMLAFFAVVFWTGIEYVRITWTFVLDFSDTPKYIFYGSMPVWGGLMFMVVLKSLVCMKDPEVTEIDAES